MKKKKTGKKGKNGIEDIIDGDDVGDDEEEEENDDDEISDEEQNKLDFIDLVKKALFETKRILENIDENGYLFT